MQLKTVGESATALKNINTILTNMSVTSQSAAVINQTLVNSLNGYSVSAIKAAIAQ